jgi:hypothetical protein
MTIVEWIVGFVIGSSFCLPLLEMGRRPRDPDWLREMHSRYHLQQKLDKNLSPEGREVLNRIMWDKYRDAV